MLVIEKKAPELARIIDGKHYGSIEVYDPKAKLSAKLTGPMYALHHIIKACEKVERASDGKEVLCLHNFAVEVRFDPSNPYAKGENVVVSTIDR